LLLTATNSVVKLITQYAIMKAHARASVLQFSHQLSLTISQRLMTTGHMAGPDIHPRKTVEVSRKPLSGLTRAKATSGTSQYTVLATHSAWFGHFHSQCVSGDQSTSNSVQ